MNIRFFDLVVMAMIGSHPEARKAFASNFWDEMGRSDPQRSHIRSFLHLFSDIGMVVANDAFASELSSLQPFHAVCGESAALLHVARCDGDHRIA